MVIVILSTWYTLLRACACSFAALILGIICSYKLFTPAPADIAPVTPTPTVIDQTPFPGDLAVGSTLTVILLVTGKLNRLSFVPACSREKKIVPTTVTRV